MYAFLFDRRSLIVVGIAVFLASLLLFGGGVLVGAQMKASSRSHAPTTWDSSVDTSTLDLLPAPRPETPPPPSTPSDISGDEVATPDASEPPLIQITPPPSTAVSSSPPPSPPPSTSPAPPSYTPPPPTAPASNPPPSSTPPPSAPPPSAPPSSAPPPSSSTSSAPPASTAESEPPTATPPDSNATPTSATKDEDTPQTSHIPSSSAPTSPPAHDEEATSGQDNSVDIDLSPVASSFTVQVGAYSVRENAERLMVRLGHHAPHIELVENTRGEILYTVRIGRFDSRQGAEQEATVLSQELEALSGDAAVLVRPISEPSP